MHVPVEPGMVQQLRWLIRVLLDWISVNRPIVRLMFDAVADWSTGRVQWFGASSLETAAA